MINKDQVLYDIKQLRTHAEACIENKKFEKALQVIRMLGKLQYEANMEYVDEIAEIYLKKIVPIMQANIYTESSEYVFFYDGFGLENRGLAEIYLKALISLKYKVIYITLKRRKNKIKRLTSFLVENNVQMEFISDMQLMKCTLQLNKLIEKYKPRKILYYSYPYDVSGVLSLACFENCGTKYLINLTDHAFWLGKNFLDISIEFRQYGASISYFFRRIESEKIKILPFYPSIESYKEFQGFPFDRINKKVVFSGGALYKTLGAENKYYDIVRHILENHKDVIFMYAGEGDGTELQKLMNEYDHRVFWVHERSDLFELLKHCDLYLNTYPMVGGLMTQYALTAGVLPITLIFDSCAEGFVLRPDKLNVEFTNVSDLFVEVDKLLTDDSYMREQREKTKGQVMTKERFELELKKLLEDNITDIFLEKKVVETQKFRDTYLERLNEKEYNEIFADERYLSIAWYFPVRYLKGMSYKISRKLLAILRKR